MRGHCSQPFEALLLRLDTYSAAQFRCPATWLVLDLSCLTWVFTANALRRVSQPSLLHGAGVAVPLLALGDVWMAFQEICGSDQPEAGCAHRGAEARYWFEISIPLIFIQNSHVLFIRKMVKFLFQIYSKPKSRGEMP
jgi:hypothetical protein